MADNYSKFLIKEYTHWSVYIHENQNYLGRCIIWCKREDALDLADATPEEQQELFVIFKELRAALTKVTNPDWFNYGFLGNETRHLHGHFLPRYEKPREFAGMTFVDERWGKSYRTDHSFVTPPAVLAEIQKQITEAIK